MVSPYYLYIYIEDNGYNGGTAKTSSIELNSD